MLFGKNGEVIDNFENENEASSMIIECALMDTFSKEELQDLLENNMYDLDKACNEGVLCERTIVRLDKHAKKSKAEKMAEFQLAKEKNDRDFKKLMTIWKLERFLEEKIHKRYGAQAKTLAKQKMKEAKNTKSKAVKKATGKVQNLLNNKNNK